MSDFFNFLTSTDNDVWPEQSLSCFVRHFYSNGMKHYHLRYSISWKGKSKLV